MQGKPTLVIGASPNPERYSYLAVTRLQKHGHSVIALGKKTGSINGIAIHTEKDPAIKIDTVTLYLSPALQQEYQDYILSLRPKRIIFNPGAENPAFEKIAEEQGIEVLEACTLTMLSIGNY